MSSIAPRKKLRRNYKNLQLVISKMLSTQSENSNNNRHSSEDRTVHGVIENKDRMNKRPCKTPNPVILKIISDMKNNSLETALARMALGPEKDVDSNHSKLNSNPIANSANQEVHSRNQIINPYFKHCNLICYPNFCTDKDPCSLW